MSISERKEMLDTLFQTIGQQHLVTERARQLSLPEPGAFPAVNGPAFSISGGVMPYELRDHLVDNGVDLEVPVHSSLMTLIDGINAKLKLNAHPRPEVDDTPSAIGEFRRLAIAIADAEENHADIDILQAALNLLGSGLLFILESTERTGVAIDKDDLATVLETSLALSRREGARQDQSLRKCAVGLLYRLCRHPAAVAAATKRLCELASDPHPTVRLAVAMDLALLFGHAPARMWKVADVLVKTEQEPVVLAQLIASTFHNLRNNDPARIESMVVHIRGRFPYESVSGNRDARTSLWEHSAQLLAAFYVWNDRKKSGNLLFEWATNPVVYFDQIRSAVYEVRTAVTRGYDADSPEFKAARMRIQALLTKVVEHSADALEAFHALSPAKQKQRQAEGKAFAHALEYACAPLYYGSGAHNEKNLPNASPVLTDPGKGRFVKDVEHMLRRLGDIAIPHTVYHLIRVLYFLLPGDPALCFDLFAHALTVSGRKYGFQGESLGVDVLVRFVSRSLADYDYIFEDPARRDKLVACLDIFIEAGWPNALRLLYRLPDSLR